jgi:hypothetical protein
MEAIEIRSPVNRKGISGLRERSGAVTGKLKGKGYFQRRGIAWNFIERKMAVLENSRPLEAVSPKAPQRLTASCPLCVTFTLHHTTSHCPCNFVPQVILTACFVLLSAFHGLPFCIVADGVFAIGSFPYTPSTVLDQAKLNAVCLCRVKLRLLTLPVQYRNSLSFDHLKR